LILLSRFCNFLSRDLKYIAHIVIVLLFPLLASAQFYVKGQVTDESGRLLQNVLIYLHSTGYVYYSGTEGSFGISSSQKKDTLSVSLDGFEKQVFPFDATVFLNIRLKKAPYNKNARLYRLASITQNLKREDQQQWVSGDETYASLVENQFVNAHTYHSTGLMLNIDRASYSNIRRFITQKNMVPPDAVRIEEMLNYFNLNYQPPPPKKTFAMETVLTSCPWNPSSQLIFAKINSKKLQLDSLPPVTLFS
jgi:Ca-activated chloride channel family protein